jgi:hypothetical protein
MRQPIRRKRQMEVTDDPFSGQERILEECHENDYLVNGSVDTVGKRKRYFRDCGCDGPVGGRCFECGAISCQKHHGHCAQCGKPICMQHSMFVAIEGQPPMRLCRRCHDETVRSRRLRNVVRTLFSPFFRFKE